MATIKIVGDAFTLTSAIKKEVYDKVKKYAPEMRVLVDEDKEPVYAIDFGTTPRLNSCGVVFTSVNTEGYITATFPIPVGVTNREEYVIDAFAANLDMLNALEQHIEKTQGILNEKIEKIASSITLTD